MLFNFNTNSFAQGNAPKQDWYKSYWPDETPSGAHITKAQTGEDWFYAVSKSIDSKTKKQDGFVCTGYQKYQCGTNLGGSNCGADYEAFKTSISSYSYDSYGTLWFLDLNGNEKWYVQFIPPANTIAYYIGGESVIQTNDGNYVVAGSLLEFTSSGILVNPNSSGAAVPLPSNNYSRKGYVCKIDKNAPHSILWQYIYDLSPLNLNSSAIYENRFQEITEDPITHHLITIGWGRETAGLDQMAAFELDENGLVLNRKTFFHTPSGSASWNTSNSEGWGILHANDGTFYAGGRTECAAACGSNNKSFVVHFNLTSSGFTQLNSQTLGFGNYNIAYDLAQLNNGDIILPSFENSCFAFYPSGVYEGKIYKLDPNSLNETLLYNLGELRANDLRMGIKKTEDGGFVFLSSKRGPVSVPDQSFTLDNLDVIEFNNPTGCNSVPISTTPQIVSNWTLETDAYLAKFKPNGTNYSLDWENKYPFTDYDGTVTNKGDVKHQECLYGVELHPDGGYMACGNNSANFDDHIVLKTFDPCTANQIYTIGANSTSTSYKTNITGVTTWTTPQNILGTIVVKSGAVLVIDNTTISFADTRQTGIPTGIIVEAGAKLIIRNHATLTSNCPKSMWDGIQVLGNSTITQNSTNQGTVEMNTGAILSNARVAIGYGNYINDFTSIYNYKEDAIHNDGGAIVKLDNCNFINNGADLELSDRVTSVADLSYIHHSVFKTDDNMPYFNNFYDETNIQSSKYLGKSHFIKLNRVEGISMYGNIIQNNSTDYLQHKGMGLYALDATFNFEYTGNIIYTVPPKNNFKNLYSAIEANTAVPHALPLIIKNTVIENVRHGINISGFSTPYPAVVLNKIKLNTDVENDVLESTWGIHLTGNTNYNVEENEISALPATTAQAQDNIVGIAVNNKHIFNASVYHNTLTGLTKGTLAFGQNGDITPMDQGLLIKCNKNYNNTNTDISLEEDAQFSISGNIKLFQGSCGTPSSPAGNVFTQTTGILHLGNTTNTAAYEYRHHSSPTIVVPSNIGNVVTPIPCISSFYNELASCPINFKNKSLLLEVYDKGITTPIKISDLPIKYGIICGGSGNGDDADTKSDLDGIEAQLLYNEYALGNIGAVLSYWQSKPCKTIQDNLALVNAYVINNNLISAQQELNNINTTNNDYLAQITMLSKQIQLLTNNQTWHDADEDFKDLITDYAGKEDGQYCTIAQNILRINNATYYNYRIPNAVVNSSRVAQKNVLTINNVATTTKLYPNPSNGEFTLEFNNVINNKSYQYLT
jgi:hypothetical protein